MKKDYVVITVKEYEALLRRSLELDLLEKAGVDNWRWYGEHRRILQDEYNSDLEPDEIIEIIIENQVISKKEFGIELLLQGE